MVFSIGNFFDDLYTSGATSAWSNRIFGNQFYLAGFITVFVVFLVLFLYPCKYKTSFSVLFKTLIYMFLLNLLFINIHDGILKREFDNSLEDKKSMALLNSLESKAAAASSSAAAASTSSMPTANIEVKPNISLYNLPNVDIVNAAQ